MENKQNEMELKPKYLCAIIIIREQQLLSLSFFSFQCMAENCFGGSLLYFHDRSAELMWNYIKKYLPSAIAAILFMVGEVLMDLLQPGLMSQIVDDGVLGMSSGGTGDLILIIHLGVMMIGCGLFGGFCGSMNNVFDQITCQNVGNKLRKDCFRQIMTFSFPQVEQFGTGSLITRVTNDISQVERYIAQFIRGFVRLMMLTVGSIVFLFRLNRTFGGIILCVFPVMLAVVGLCLRQGNPMFVQLQERLDELNTILQEDVSGIRIIKACVRETYEKLRFGKKNEELIGVQLRILVLFAFMNPIMNALMYLAVAVILAAGAVQVTQGTVTPGVIMAAITYTGQLLNGVLMLVMLFQNISRGAASWKRVQQVLSTEGELQDGDWKEETELKGQVEFRDVSFSYPGSSRKVLEHLNLTICPGETVAILGATGCGKSTLVNLIPRFYDVTEGCVLVDGVDVRRYPLKDLREKMGIALQKSELYNRTIQENLAWGKPGASLEALQKAAQIAQAANFIEETPEGFQTMVAERGMSLSGGQKQRLSIARAVLKGAEILILDDATSALDLKTEAKLYGALEQERPDCTRIIVAQRIASVRYADRIVLLEHGRIGAIGTHEELLKTSAGYREIYDSQMEQEG